MIYFNVRFENSTWKIFPDETSFSWNIFLFLHKHSINYSISYTIQSCKMNRTIYFVSNEITADKLTTLVNCTPRRLVQTFQLWFFLCNMIKQTFLDSSAHSVGKVFWLNSNVSFMSLKQDAHAFAKLWGIIFIKKLVSEILKFKKGSALIFKKVSQKLLPNVIKMCQNNIKNLKFKHPFFSSTNLIKSCAKAVCWK